MSAPKADKTAGEPEFLVCRRDRYPAAAVKGEKEEMFGWCAGRGSGQHLVDP